MSYDGTTKKEGIAIHIIFLFILSSYYLLPYFLIGQLIVKPHDILDSEIVYNHIIGRIYRGEIESINLFLAGEIKWYYLKRILQPLTLLYGLFGTELAYWLTDILVKLISYTCFFKLSRKLNCTVFNSALISSLFACAIDTQNHFGLGLPTFPYLIYLVIKNKNINLKHYCLLAFIGLNTDLAADVSFLPILFFIFLILCSKLQKYNFKLFFKISFVLFFFILLSNSNLLYAQLFSEPFHRTSFVYENPDLITNFNKLIRGFFSIPDISGNPYFFWSIPSTFYIFPIIVVSLLSMNKKTYLLLLIVFLILLTDFISNLEFVVSLKNNSEGLLKTIHWNQYMLRLCPVLYGLLFITISRSEVVKKIKYILYPLLFLSLISFQIKISAVPLGKFLISFNNLSIDQKNQLRKSFHDQKYTLLFRNISEFNKNRTKESGQNFKSNYSFKGYYDYENYKYIKSLVGNSRTLSVDLDPMVAVMNNIKVVDGYHNLYPLSYKLKFRKVIEEQLNHYKEIKKYYDYWGQRIYTFVSDPNVIKIDFHQAEILGAEYVISKYSISSEILIPICEKCNNSTKLFLYKIKT